MKTMITIVAIPSYYRTDSYVFIYKDSQNERPTTTTRYIVLTPASTETLTIRNTAIAKDVAAWGWHIYNTHPSAANMEIWFEKYEAAAKKNTWNEDIWRIWQREHGVRIAEADARRKGKEESDKGKMAGVKHGVKKAGVLLGKFTMTLDYE
jgi:predicted nuclease with RNAse H fold